MSIKKKTYFTFGIFAALIVLSVAFGVIPLVSDIKRGADDLVDTRKEMALLEVENSNLDALRGQYKSYESDLQKINNLFIDPDVPVDFIRFLEKISADSKSPVIINPASNSRPGGNSWPFFDFQISSIASFLNFARFLDKLENSNYLVEIQNINIRITAGEESENKKSQEVYDNIRADFSIRVFTK